MDVNSRIKQIEDLGTFISEKTKMLADIMCELGWAEESLQDELKTPCPVDPGHWITESSVKHHVETCSWVKDGYLKEELNEDTPSSKFFYEKAQSVVSTVVDKELQAKILSESGLLCKDENASEDVPDVPKTVDRATVELTREQRLAIYDYVVQESKAPNKNQNVKLEDLMFDFEKKEEETDAKPKSYFDMLVEQRDYKRRRQTYRAKNVHITKKSYTEIMKEVIANQISYLADSQKLEENSEQSDNSQADTKSRMYDDSDTKDDDVSEKSRHKKSKRHKSRRDRSESSSRHHKHKHKRSESHHKHKKSHKKHKS